MAVNSLHAKEHANEPVSRPQVNTAIDAFRHDGLTVDRAAGGKITFDNNGNRNDSDPVVVRLCPPMGSSTQPQTVPASPGDCPSGSSPGG